MPVDPHFTPQINKLLESMHKGFFKPCEVKDLQTSAPVVYCEHENVCDHFKLQIPYAGYKLAWEVRFDSNCPTYAPDFVFDDDSFNLYLDADIISQRVPALDRWDIEIPECLSTVVQQLLNVYTLYQLQRMERDRSSLPEECSKFIQEFDLEEKQLQVLAGNTPVSPHFYGSSTRPPANSVSVMFLHLEKQISFEGIPESFRQMALQFVNREYSPTTVSFYISPVLQDIIGDGDLEIPNYSKSDGLSKYFHHFLGVLNETFNQVSESFQKRQQFHLGLLYDLRESELITLTPIENDMPKFTMSSYMVEIEDFPVVIIAHTPVDSSGDPKVTLRTIAGGGIDIHIDSMWDTQLIVEEIINTVGEIKKISCGIIG